MRRRELAAVVLLMAGALLSRGAEAEAAPIYRVTVDTSSLVGMGTFALDFQLLDGDGQAGNNTVTLSSFSFGGGMPDGAPFLDGGATGSVGGTATLTDTGFFNALFQPFAAGSALSFDMTFTTDFSGVFAPDRFTLALVDDSFMEVPTLGFADELLGIDLLPGVVIETYGSDPNRTSLDIPAPAVEVVPEPSTVLLLGTGLALAARRRRRSSAGPGER